jgi:hypothetical protein
MIPFDSYPSGGRKLLGLAKGSNCRRDYGPQFMRLTGEKRCAYCRALQCLSQIAGSSFPSRGVTAQLLEPPCTDPYTRWCGKGQRATAAPMPIKSASRNRFINCRRRLPQLHSFPSGSVSSHGIRDVYSRAHSLNCSPLTRSIQSTFLPFSFS